MIFQGGDHLADNKKDFMGGNAIRDGDAVRKIAKEIGVDHARLKSLVEAEKKGGTNNLSYDYIRQIAISIKR